MFIENMRHAKHKKRWLVGIILAAVLVGLFAMYGNLGNNLGISSSSSNDALSTAQDTAKSAASAAKSSEDDMDAQGTAASDYLSLAAYQSLYLEDNTKSYEKALDYAKAMVTACGSAETPDYETAYGYEFSAYEGLGDADGLSSAFNESLSYVDLTESYLSTYYSAMSSLEAYDQFNTDMDTVTTKLEKLEAKEGSSSTTTDSEDESETVTTSDLIDYVASLVSESTSAAAESETASD
jgi:hypothetical protein